MEIVVKQKRAAAYCRVSTGMECQEGSYEIQKSYFTELLSNNPDEKLVKVYADEGSGRSTQGRPEFRQMIQDCMDGKIDIIYTKSISRFSRNMQNWQTPLFCRHSRIIGRHCSSWCRSRKNGNTGPAKRNWSDSSTRSGIAP